MSNLSVLSIPIASPPTTPPPLGQAFVFFDLEGQLQIMNSDGMQEPLHLRKHTETITLTEAFDVIGLDNEGGNTLTLTGDLSARIANRTVTLMEESNGSSSIRVVRQVTVNEEGNTEVTFRRSSFSSGLVGSAKIHLSREVNIEHLLESNAVTLSLRNVATGQSVSVADRIVDENNVLITANTPTLGEFRVMIVA